MTIPTEQPSDRMSTAYRSGAGVSPRRAPAPPFRRRFLRHSRLSLLLLAVAACRPESGAPPRLVVDESACAYCSMLISEPRFAAGYRIDDRERVFDDIGCLLNTLEAEATEPLEGRVWVRDLEDAGWIPASEATFVHSAELHTPMRGAIVAFRDRGAASRVATEHDGRVLATLAELAAVHRPLEARR